MRGGAHHESPPRLLPLLQSDAWKAQPPFLRRMQRACLGQDGGDLGRQRRREPVSSPPVNDARTLSSFSTARSTSAPALASSEASGRGLSAPWKWAIEFTCSPDASASKTPALLESA